MWVVMKKICCEKCFEISDIQNFIKEFKQSGNCDYCGSCNVFILDIKKVGEFILESVKRAYEDAANHVSYSSRDGGYLMSTYSITEILLEKEEIFSDRLDEPRYLAEELIPDDGTEYVKRDPYGPPPGEPEEITWWEKFCQTVKKEKRFTFFTQNLKIYVLSTIVCEIFFLILQKGFYLP